MSFVHLHVHSHYSLLDGFGTPREIVKAAKEMGCPAVAITDHGVLYGAVEFYKAAKEFGITPIIGCEMYVAPAGRFDKTPGAENKPYHLTLLATSTEGYQNLMLLVSKAHLEGFYYKPRIDHELLRAYGKGLIALSGCLAGELARTVNSSDEAKQIQVIRLYQDILGKENFYLELQDHPFLDEQKVLNERLLALSQKTGAPLVATQDSHYIRKEDAKAQDILLCIQTQATVDETDRMKFDGDFSLRTPEEMRESFAHVPEALENTIKIAERCHIELEFGQDLIPSFTTPAGESAKEYLRTLCEEGLLKQYGGTVPEEAVKQLEYELGVVDTMGFNDYFLIVWDFVKYAKDRGIAVGPGRGSAAGSLITYCLDITELNPLQYGLIFERFLNPERISMPDIDIDFADILRDQVLEYVREKYGRENVAQIITFGTMAARAAVRDTGRAMGYPYAEVDRIAKMVPPPVQGRHVPLQESVMNDPEVKQLYQTDPRAHELLDNAIKLEGTVRHAGTHASAVVMSQKPLVLYTPLQKASGEGQEIITQYSMKITEEIGLLKMDFLGLKNLTIIQETLRLVQQTRGETVVMKQIPMDDLSTFELLQRGDTTGVFQLESAGMRRYIRELKPTSFQDIIAMVALYRPGPMEWIPGYIQAKHNPSSIRYLHASFESILKETNGVAIYQEQILQIARDFAGFSLGEADLLRKAVGKKDPRLLQQQKEKFIEGALQKSHKKTFAEEVFEKVIEPFAGYGFNKAHAACYAMISYRTAYLKAHYPTEFMAALLSCDRDNTDRVVLEITECEEMGISVLPPSINESFSDFTVVNEKTIRFGLSAIKKLGSNTIDEILVVRKNGPFTSLENILERIPAKLLNKKSIEALSLSGAMDEFGDRKALSESSEEMSHFSRAVQENAVQGQGSLFGGTPADEVSTSFRLKKSTPFSLMEKLRLEKEFLGLYVSGHPLKGLRRYLAKKVHLVDSLTVKNAGHRMKIGGILTRIKKVFTKSGSYMLYGELEDPTGRIEIVVFPKAYSAYGTFFQEDQVLLLEGKVELRRGTFQFSADTAKSLSLDSMIANAKEAGVYDEKEKMVRKQKQILEVASASEGGGVSAGDFRQPEGVVAAAAGGVVSGSGAFASGHASVDIREEWKENPYCIEVPATASKEVLQRLKTLLLEHPGDRSVEILLGGAANEGGAGVPPVKKVRLSLSIHLTPELEQGVQEILGS